MIFNKKQSKKFWFVLSACFIITLICFIFDVVGIFQRIEYSINDLIIRTKPNSYKKISDDIILVAIDDESLEQIGRWPWNRAIFAEFLKLIKVGSPKAVIFDIEFLEKFQKNSKLEQCNLYTPLEIWYETLSLEDKKLLESDSDEAIIKLITNYRQFLASSNLSSSCSKTDDDFLSLALKDTNSYLAMHFTYDLLQFLPILHKSKTQFFKLIETFPKKMQNEIYKDFLIYLKINENFTYSAEEIANLTGLDLKYVKSKLFDLRNTYIKNCIDKILNLYSNKDINNLDINEIRLLIFKKIGVTSEIELLQKDIFLSFEDIIASRLEYLNNLKIVLERDSISLPDDVKNFFREKFNQMIPILPVTNLLINSKNIGFANNNPDFDGIYRRYPLFFEINDKFLPQLSIQVLRNIMGLDFSNSKLINNNLLVVPINNEYFKKKNGDVLYIPLNNDKTCTFNWMANYVSNKFKVTSFFNHFFSLIQMEKKVYLFLAETLFENIDEKCIQFFKIYHKIQTEGLTPTNIENLKNLINITLNDLNEMIENLSSFLNNPNLSLEKMKKLRTKLYNMHIVRLQLTSFLKNITTKDSIINNLKDKILIIGLAANGTSDIKPTAVSPETPMYFGHANIINSFLNAQFIKYLTFNQKLIINILIVTFMIFLLTFLHPIKAFIILLFLIICYLSVAFIIFWKYNLFISITSVLISVIISFFIATLYTYFHEEREKQFIRQAFSHYLSPNAMEEILRDPENLKLKGEKRILTVLFSDIRSFTTFSENHTPEEVVAMLNEYLDYMTEIIFKYQGTLDKYVGDEIMAIFGAPSQVIQTDHCARALFTSFEMLEVLKELQKKWILEDKQPIDIGIGFNSGEMIVGNMGSKKHFDYTVIGDHVNLAARVEALTRNYNNHIIFTEYSLEYIKDLCTYKFLDTIKVKGKNKPVSIYEPIALTEKGINEMQKFGPKIKVIY